MGTKTYNILVRKGITLLVILWFFAVFSGEFGCSKRYLETKPENFKFLEGTLVHLYKKTLLVKSDDGQKINFRVGRRTVFIPEGLPGIGDRLRVRYLNRVFWGLRGDYFIAYEVRKLDYTTDVSSETAFPSSEIQKKKITISESEKAKITILEFQGLN